MLAMLAVLLSLLACVCPALKSLPSGGVVLAAALSSRSNTGVGLLLGLQCSRACAVELGLVGVVLCGNSAHCQLLLVAILCGLTCRCFSGLSARVGMVTVYV